MANLKELRNKIGVVQSTRKVTAAMKLVAGVKLKKAEQKATTSREYANELKAILARTRGEYVNVNYELLLGREDINTEILVVFASDKGLCGNFNYLINRKVSDVIAEIHLKNRKVNIICIGAKVFDVLKRKLHDDESIELMGDFYRNEKLFENSTKLAEKVIAEFTLKNVDAVSVVYTKYYSAIRRQVEVKSIIPLICEPNFCKTDTIFEPDVKFILETIVPYNIAVQLYQTALESIAGEQGSRMTSMDSATRNADELLSDLSIRYNRTRQYNITQELVEVVSGAAAIGEG